MASSSRLNLCVWALLSTSNIMRGAQPETTLVRDWTASLGPLGEGHYFFRGAACPDGTYYLTDGQGRVIRLLADGTTASDVHIDGMDALATACDGQGRLVAVPDRSILTIGPDPRGDLSVLRSVALGKEIDSSHAAAALEGGELLVLGLKGHAGYLHLVNERGQVLASYGAATASPPWSISTVMNGTVALDPTSKRVTYIPENPYVFMEYDPLLGVARSVQRNDSSFQGPSGSGTGRSPGDRVMRAVYLPGGDLLVQVVKRSVAFNAQVQDNVLRSSSYLELFDHSLNLKATGIPVAGFGQLQGASRDGSLYFNLISPMGGIRVIKAHLTAGT